MKVPSKLADFVIEAGVVVTILHSAGDRGWAYEDLLRELLEAEVTNRRESSARRLLREARFPDLKTFDQVDWAALKGIARPKILELASGDFIGRAENVILASPIGTGKTMLAIALVVEATRRRYRVLFTRAAVSSAEPNRGTR
jgi:DNA replication protein DnaC